MDDKYLGKRLDGRYEMRELIGVGGMACVYKAYDCIDDRTVAVKILKDEFLDNEEFTRRFRNESKAIAILNHPNIVKVLDVGFGDRLQYIVMEYIDGITLKEYLDQRHDIRWKEAVHFAVQILRALQHAHDKGIVHRDIKPQNIMLLSDGTLKVTDFGIARLSRNEVRATVDGEKAIGSVHYISPEQARGEITDEKTDLYSVGVVLYEMLTGRLPFEADNAVSVAIMQMQSEATLPREINEDVPEGLEQITMKAMEKDPSKRYQSAAEMLSDIDEFKRNPSIKFEYTYFVDEKPTRYVDAITRVRGEDGDADSVKKKSGKKKSSTVAILAAVAAAVLIVAIVLLALAFPRLLGGSGRKNIIVDNFVGKSYTDEITAMPNIGNYTIKVEQGYNADYPAGTVYKQSPEEGRTIKMKGQVTLYVSLGSRLEEVPVMTPGESVAMVRSRLDAAGFEVTEAEETSLTCKQGTVVRLEPPSGSKVQYGSEVVMFISSGEPTAEPITMPNVNGMGSADAIKKLVLAGFEQNNIQTTYVNNAAVKDTVIAVTPDYAFKQQPDAQIMLTVSTGFRDVPIRLRMPSTSSTVDLQFFVDGIKNDELTAKYTGIVPRDIRTLEFTTTQPKDSYVVTVKISPAGAGQFDIYATYTVSGATGGVLSEQIYPYTERSATTASRTTETSATETTETSETHE